MITRPIDRIANVLEGDNIELVRIFSPEYSSTLLKVKDVDKLISSLKEYITKYLHNELGSYILLQKIYVYKVIDRFVIEIFLKPKDNAMILEYHLTFGPNQKTQLNKVVRDHD